MMIFQRILSFLGLRVLKIKKYSKLLTPEKNGYKFISFPIVEIDDFYIHNSFKPKNKYFKFKSL
mgnify:CR=1 FL=1